MLGKSPIFLGVWMGVICRLIFYGFLRLHFQGRQQPSGRKGRKKGRKNRIFAKNQSRQFFSPLFGIPEPGGFFGGCPIASVEGYHRQNDYLIVRLQVVGH